MMKKLLLTLMLLLTAVFTIAAQQIPLPEIVVTPSEDSYTFTVIDQGEFQITCSYYDFETGEYGPEEEIQFPLTIYRTERPKQLYIKAFQAVGEYEFHTFTEYHFIAPLGDEIPPAPEITVTKEDNGWDGFHYVVSAVGDGNVIFSRKLSDGSWERATDSDSEGHPCFILSPEINIDLLYQFKAYQESEFKQFYLDDEHTCYYTVRSPETRWEYVVPGIKSLNGDIIFQMAGEGLLSVTYTGNEEVTISVTINDNPVELVDGMVHLVPGYNMIHAIVSAEGYINSPLEGWFEIRWNAPTPEPQIIVTPGDQAYTIEAIGEGEVHLRCYHECDYHHLHGDVENPVTISRTQFDEFFNFEATARLGEGYNEAIVSQDVWVPALGATPMPDIVFTEDETGCEVRAVGQGEVHLFLGGRYHGQEVENPYRIPRPYQQDYYSFEAYAQAEGQWESEVAWETIEVTPLPWIEINEGLTSGFYDIQVFGMGSVRLYLDGEEVENPYRFDGRGKATEMTYRITATCREDGKLTGQSEQLLEVSSAPKNANFIHISYDDDNCYILAESIGYINLTANCYAVGTEYNNYEEKSAEGFNQVVLVIPRQEYNQQGDYYVTCVDNVNNSYIYDTGEIVVFSKLLNKAGIRPFLFMTESTDTYFVKSCPQYLIVPPELNGVMLNYNTPLMLNGEVVENHWTMDRPEHGAGCSTYDFSTVTKLSLVRYDAEKYYIGGKYYPGDAIEFTVDDVIETVDICSDTIKRTLFVAERGWEHFIDGYEYDEFFDSFIDGSLLYNIHVIGGGELGTHADYANVGNNRNDSHRVAMIPNHINVKSYYGTANLFTYGEYDNVFTCWGDIGLIYYDLHNGMSIFRAVDNQVDWGGHWQSTIPVTAIADSAFIGNQSLTGVEIGKNVTSIGKDAFKGCSDLTDVTCFATTPPAMTNVETFDEACYSNATLRVPESSVDKYKNADWWRKFRHIEGVAVPGLPGDVNGDGELGIADINTLIDAILMSNTQSIYDINGDGEITISDVMALIDMYLSMD